MISTLPTALSQVQSLTTISSSSSLTMIDPTTMTALQSFLTPMFPAYYFLSTNPLFVTSVYMVVSNLVYLGRRAHLRRTNMWSIWQIRTMREPGVSWPLYCVLVMAWQFLVALFPVTEPLARLSGYASFFYSYPNAKGGGYILEPLEVQTLPSNQRTRAQLRLDWHRFKYNVGVVGRDGYRHPPAKHRNLPHIDIPKKGLKHWPWRRRHSFQLTKENTR
jgi:hypothetical protein